MVKDLTEGNVAKLLLAFAAPLFVSNALQAIYNIVDMVVVGQVIGGSGMSAVATGGNILHLLNFLALGFSSAGQIIIAKDVGAGDFKGVRKTIGTLFTMMIVMSLAMSVVCYFYRTQILNLVNTPAEAFEYTMDYTVICIIGLVFIYGYNVVSAIMRGMGDSKRPFMFIAIASVLNTVLDILFVAILKMEVKGAALATVIGQSFSFLFALYYLYKHKEEFGFDFKPKSFIPDRVTLSKLTALGIPMAIQSAAVSISMTVVAAWVNSFGVIYSAIAGIISKLNTMMGIMSNALSTAAASMVGQNLGAKKYERIPKILGVTVICSLMLAIVCSIAVLCWPEAIFRMFTSDKEVLAEASIILLPCVLNFGGAVSRSFGFGMINGSGNSRLNLLVAILDGIVVRIGAAYLLGFTLGLHALGFWLGDAIAGYMPFVIGGIFFLSGRWKK